MARVETIDTRVDPRAWSSDGEGGSRPAGDWLAPAEALFAAAERSGRGVGGLLRVEYANDAEDQLAVIGPAADGWLVRLCFEHDGAAPRIAGIELRPSSTASDPLIGSRYLRRLGFGAVLKGIGDLLEVDYLVSGLAGGKWRRRVHRPGRAGRPDVFYAEWAQRYVGACRAEPAAPIRHLVEQERAMGRHCTAAEVRAFLYRARARGLLTAAPAGRSGGELTPAALALLRGRAS